MTRSPPTAASRRWLPCRARGTPRCCGWSRWPRARARRSRAPGAGVCCEAAADPALAVVLVGLGISSLSMAAGSIAVVRSQVGRVTLDECRQVARLALAAGSAQAAATPSAPRSRTDLVPRGGGSRHLGAAKRRLIPHRGTRWAASRALGQASRLPLAPAPCQACSQRRAVNELPTRDTSPVGRTRARGGCDRRGAMPASTRCDGRGRRPRPTRRRAAPRRPRCPGAATGVGDDRLHPPVSGVRPDADRLLQQPPERGVREVAVLDPRHQVRVQRLRDERAHERDNLAVDAAQALEPDGGSSGCQRERLGQPRVGCHDLDPNQVVGHLEPRRREVVEEAERGSQQPLGQGRARDERALAAQPVQLAAGDEPADRLADDRPRDAKLRAQLRSVGSMSPALSSPDISCCSRICSSCA